MRIRNCLLSMVLAVSMVISLPGMSMTTAFTIFAKKVSREKRIPFEISIDPFYSESNISYLKKLMSDIDSGKTKLVEHDLIEKK